MASRTLNSKRNIIAGVAYRLIAILLPFINRTIIIRFLGAEYQGLGSLFSSILEVLNLTELGFSSAVVFCMYKMVAEADEDSICAKPTVGIKHNAKIAIKFFVFINISTI